jgi:hypothetical protein
MSLWVAQLEERQTVMVNMNLNVTGSIPVPERIFILHFSQVAKPHRTSHHIKPRSAFQSSVEYIYINASTRFTWALTGGLDDMINYILLVSRQGTPVGLLPLLVYDLLFQGKYGWQNGSRLCPQKPSLRL